MRRRFLELIAVIAVVMAMVVLLRLARVPAGSPTRPSLAGVVEVGGEGVQASAAAADEVPATRGPAPRTAWDEPDLQGIWTDIYQTPLQRSARYAGKESFTDAEREALDKQRSTIELRPRQQAGTERDVAGAYNAVFMSVKPAGRRTSLVVDPPDGRIPPITPELQSRIAAEREYRLALLQSTVTCKNQEPGCRGGKYGAPSPRRAENPPRYNTGNINRVDNPEDRSMSERCMSAVLPDFSGFRRIVQSPGAVAIFYDTGQGQGWQRNIPLDGKPHLPGSIRQRFGDSRGRWEGDTLVVDVTNFSPKSEFQGSRENLHLVERWTRTGPDTLEYAVTIDDPTTWTKSWTVKQEYTRQNDQANRIYSEPRCHEGNYGLAGLLAGGRAAEKAFAEGRGPHPATIDNATGMQAPEDAVDPLTQ